MMGENTPIFRNLRIQLEGGSRKVTTGKFLVYADDVLVVMDADPTLKLDEKKAHFGSEVRFLGHTVVPCRKANGSVRFSNMCW